MADALNLTDSDFDAWVRREIPVLHFGGRTSWDAFLEWVKRQPPEIALEAIDAVLDYDESCRLGAYRL